MNDKRPPVFTIGNRDGYIKSLAEMRAKGEILLKVGRTGAGKGSVPPDYQGGIIFQNPVDARKYINEEISENRRSTFGVFEVDASWEHDCYAADPDDYWKNLLTDRPIICLVEDA